MLRVGWGCGVFLELIQGCTRSAVPGFCEASHASIAFQGNSRQRWVALDPGGAPGQAGIADRADGIYAGCVRDWNVAASSGCVSAGDEAFDQIRRFTLLIDGRTAGSAFIVWGLKIG